MEDNTNACAHMQTHMYTLRWTHHAARLQTWKTADMHASPYQTQIHFLLSCWSSMILSPKCGIICSRHDGLHILQAELDAQTH